MLPFIDEAVDFVGKLKTQYPDFVKLLARHATPAKALRHFALGFWRDGRLDVATDLLRHSLAMQSDDPDTWRDFSFICYGLGDLPRSEAAAIQSLELAMDHAATWTHLANLYQQTTRPAEAAAAFRKAAAASAGRVVCW